MPFEDKNPIVTGSQLQIVNANGDTVASVDESGTGSFQDLTSVQSPTFYGLDLQTEIVGPLPKGVVATGFINSFLDDTTTELGLIEVAFTLNDASRNYRIDASYLGIGGNPGNNAGINIRYTTAALGVTPSRPSTSSTLLFQHATPLPSTSFGETVRLSEKMQLPVGNYRFLMSAIRLNGTGLLTVSTTAVNPVRMDIVDEGIARPNVGVPNDGSGGAGGPVQQYTETYLPIWSRAYNGNGTPGSFGSSGSIYQGYNQSDGNGNRKSMIGYDWAHIQADLTGATVNKFYLTMMFRHWYNFSGGTAVIGYHASTSGSPPGSWSGIPVTTSTNWPNPGLRTVDLTSAGFGSAFATGTARGLTLGPGSSTAATFYGYADGAGMSNPPYITIVYTK